MSMMIEAVPNFSEGQRTNVMEAIAAEARATGARVLDLHIDSDHNRSVLTLAGSPETALEAAFRTARKAMELIDLNRHSGQHPRMGAVDVIPFVPLQGASMDDAVALARALGRRLGEELGLPVFLYEFAATRPERRNLADLRHPGFEGLRELIGKDPQWTPDFGPPQIHPTAGCAAVGARKILVAYNVDLETEDVAVARKIARTIRRRDGGLPGVKALGLFLAARRCAQVSVNVCDIAATSLMDVFHAVETEAKRLGTAARSSEIVGLVPQAALPEDPQRALRLEGFSFRQILEHRIQEPRLRT